MPFCCFPFYCGKKSKSRHQKTVHPIYSTHPVDPGTKNTHVERGYGPYSINVNSQELQQTIRQQGEASTCLQQEQINLEDHLDARNQLVSLISLVFREEKSRKGSKDLVLRVDKTTNHLKGIRIWDGDTQVDFLIVESEDQGVKEPNVQQKPHAGRATAYVQ
ncbi:hypothetical protein POTOM_036411 [Populus tomentosa]|uniref:Uncharacterized protein n=1 Tax=Populus tomentosa TaxID=118781 RepID=A0A8X7Z0N8_POPTO|nr:hypothetical protein POTOM_036411 [Populus tomentosa]